MFQLSGNATIEHVNLRRGTADEAVVSIDIKLALEGVSIEAAAAALGADSPADIDRALFRSLSEDADRNARFLGLKRIECEAVWENKHALTIKGSRTVRADRVGKITLKPRAAGKFDCTFQATIKDPPQGYVEDIAGALGAAREISLEQDPELPLTAPAAKASAVPGMKRLN